MFRKHVPNAVIDQIYQASIVGDWRRVLRPVLEWTGSSAGAYLGICKPSKQIAFCEVLDIPKRMLHEYDTEFIRRDPRVGYAIEHPGSQINHDAQHMTERRLWNDDYFAWLADYGFRYYLSLQLLDETDLVCHCSIQRQPTDGPATPEQIRAARLLLPHMQRGLRLYRSVLQQHGVATTALDVLENRSEPIFLCTPDGRIVWRNRAAAELLGTPECFLEEIGGCLRPKVRRQWDPWQRWMAGAAWAVGDPLAAMTPHFQLERVHLATGARPPGALPCRATVHPLPSSATLFPDLSLPRLAITIRSNRPDTVPPESLRRMFGLTPREAEVALEVFRGRTVAEAAEALEIKVQTARGYLKQVLQKTGVRRQAELVRLLGALENDSDTLAVPQER